MATVGSGKYRYRLVENFGQLPAGETFGNASAVATDSQDRVYVFQRKDPPVVVFDPDGRHLGSWGIGAFASPHGIYIANDIVYLTDRDDSVCLMYTLDGKPLQVLGKRGVHSDTGCEKPGTLVPRSAGPFNYPTEMVPSPSGNLYVTDGYRTAWWWTRAAWSTCATGRTTASRCSRPTASSSRSGPTCAGRSISPSTATACSASARVA